MQEEKTVPIDTSGESLDVTLEEENTKKVEPENTETPTVEVQEPQETVEETKTVDDETKEYSASVKKRIDKLTKRLREAERREEAAISYAQGVQKESKEIKQKYETLDKNYIDEFGSRVENQLDLAKNKLKNAIANRDVEGQIEANQEIAKLTIDAERIKYSKQIQENDAKSEDKKTEEKPYEPKPKADPKAVEWAEKNTWFGEDEVMTEAARAIHKNLVLTERVDPKSDLYYDQLDKRLREYFPNKFSQGGSTETTKVAQPVASATRTQKQGRRIVRLSPSQVAMAKKLGVTPEQYAKHVKEA
jgi:hypothetical protein|tara:strand:+ start:3814 stop:4725 length:912 start_codon:yes stop_codon:yes gene_type:complete